MHLPLIALTQPNMGGRLFSKMFIPSVDGEMDFSHLPYEQQGLVRSMNRSAKLAVACALKMEPEAREVLSRFKETTAVYCATEPATPNQQLVLEMLNQEPSDLAKAYSQTVSPKWGLQCGASMVAPSLSIFLGAEGGVHTFSSGRHSLQQALAQAQLDLRLGDVTIAVVCAVNSAEDVFVIDRARRKTPGVELVEGASIAILRRPDE
jgi:3-oxoacyl-(acyl-carrier-protein) synthase